MKTLKSTPKVMDFFQVYARLARSIRTAGVFAQIVSAATEITILYALSHQAIVPILPELAPYIAGAVAALGVIVIEGGLRVSTPQAVDAVLYGRFAGLHLVMTIAVFVVVILLGGASGWLSFTNSTTIVDGMTAARFDQERAAADSTYQAATADQRAQWLADSSTIATRHAGLIAAAQAAGEAREKAAETELSNIRRQERRTGNSFASAKDGAKANLAAIRAENAGMLASMQAARENELSEARTAFRAKIGGAEEARAGTVAAIDGNQVQTVAKYGGGLGWFTVICLVVFFAAVILDRVHHKGSEINETVEISQYDINPPWWANLGEAIRERWNYAVQSRITAFAERTPAAPLPARPGELYDPTQVANVTVTLKIQQDDTGEGENVIHIAPKRRQIGFKQGGAGDPGATNYAPPFTAHEGGHEEDLRDLKTRLKFYKKRLGTHTQKAKAIERKGEPVPQRTLDAIDNNRQWVQHYETLIQAAKQRD